MINQGSIEPFNLGAIVEDIMDLSPSFRSHKFVWIPIYASFATHRLRHHGKNISHALL